MFIQIVWNVHALRGFINLSCSSQCNIDTILLVLVSCQQLRSGEVRDALSDVPGANAGMEWIRDSEPTRHLIHAPERPSVPGPFLVRINLTE
jgi:hypothetical protein